MTGNNALARRNRSEAAVNDRLVRHTIVTTSYRNAKGRLGALKRFSAYLAQFRPGIEPQAVDRSLMVAYLAHIQTMGMAPATVGVWLVALRSFFELCAREGWAGPARGRI